MESLLDGEELRLLKQAWVHHTEKAQALAASTKEEVPISATPSAKVSTTPPAVYTHPVEEQDRAVLPKEKRIDAGMEFGQAEDSENESGKKRKKKKKKKKKRRREEDDNLSTGDGGIKVKIKIGKEAMNSPGEELENFSDE